MILNRDTPGVEMRPYRCGWRTRRRPPARNFLLQLTREGRLTALEIREEVLYPHQVRLLELLTAGRSYKEAAGIMGTTHGTVRQMALTLARSLGLSGQTQLTLWAVRTLGM